MVVAQVAEQSHPIPEVWSGREWSTYKLIEMFFQGYPPHSVLRTTPYPSGVQPGQPPTSVQPPPSSMGYGGGYTLPPTAAYFPVGTYSTVQVPTL